MKLTGTAISYSPSEQRAFALLGKRPKTTLQLADELYANGDRPYNDRGVVLDIMKKLIHKVHNNREPFVIRRTQRRGPHPVSFWIERK